MSRIEERHVRDAYDRWHTDRAVDDNAITDLHNPWNSFVCENLPPIAGKLVLEIGCGRGQLTAHLAANGANVIGADFSVQALSLARHRITDDGYPAILLNADACHIPLADQSIDVVISCETIEHTPNPQAALAEFYRVLKPGGKLILTFPSYLNMSGLHRLYLWVRGRPYDSGASVQPIEQPLISFRVLAALRRLQFRIRRTHGTIHNLLLPGFTPMRLTALEQIPIIRTIAKPFALHIGVIAERQ
jgi:SAM-dependent methyltransferase